MILRYVRLTLCLLLPKIPIFTVIPYVMLVFISGRAEMGPATASLALRAMSTQTL